METVQRAVLFVDIAGSTRIYESLGDTRALELIADLFGHLDKAAASHGGTVVKKLGDGMVYAFAAPAEACEAACEMQLTTQRAAADGGPAPIAIRAGFNFGPVVISEIYFAPPSEFIAGEYRENTWDEFIELHNITDQPVASKIGLPKRPFLPKRRTR